MVRISVVKQSVDPVVMDHAVVDCDGRAFNYFEKVFCKTIVSSRSVIVDIAAADNYVLTSTDFNCTDAAFIDIAARDVKLLTVISYNTDSTTSVKTAFVYIYINAGLHLKNAACATIGWFHRMTGREI